MPTVAVTHFWLAGGGVTSPVGEASGAVWVRRKRKPMFVMPLSIEQKKMLIEWLQLEVT